MLYKFRVLIDYEKDVFREIEILSDQTYMDLNNAILNAFEFSGEQMASFYMSNDDWDKGEEIMMFDMGDDQLGRSMENTQLKDLVSEVNQKVLYIYDFLRFWIFYIELVSIRDEESNVNYPILVGQFGLAPKEDEKSDDFEMPQDHIGEDSELDPELRDLLGDNDDDDESGHIDPNDLASFY